MPGAIGQIGRMIGRQGLSAPSKGVVFSPLDLGAALYDMWDAERASDIALSGSAVTAWASAKNAYSMAQAASNARPTYGAASFNGRPGLTFDGVDDCLALTGVGNFPTGSTAREVWALVDQTALQADTTNRRILAYGAGDNVNDLALLRYNAGGTQRINCNVGTGAANPGADNSVVAAGKLAIRAQVGAASTLVTVNGVAGTTLSAVPTTGTTRARIGATASTTAGAFFQGVMSLIAVTQPLTTDQAAQMLAYLKARGSIA